MFLSYFHVVHPVSTAALQRQAHFNPKIHGLKPQTTGMQKIDINENQDFVGCQIQGFREKDDPIIRQCPRLWMGSGLKYM